MRQEGKDSLDLFMTHRGELVDYASGIAGSRAHGEDIVQEAWLRFDGAAGRRLLDEPLRYLYRIVRNIALDGHRRQAREDRYTAAQFGAASAAVPDSHSSPETEALHRQQLALVRAALAELPERTRIAVEMHRLEGCKLREIAVRLDVSIALAHALVTGGVEHCRQRLRHRS